MNKRRYSALLTSISNYIPNSGEKPLYIEKNKEHSAIGTHSLLTTYSYLNTFVTNCQDFFRKNCHAGFHVAMIAYL